MDKAADNRSESAAGNKKSDKNPHLSDEKLLLAMDGELAAGESAQVKIHLQACWSCRARNHRQCRRVPGSIGHILWTYFY